MNNSLNAILTALEPCRAALEASCLRRLRAQSDLVAKHLEKHDWNFRAAFPFGYPREGNTQREMAKALVVNAPNNPYALRPSEAWLVTMRPNLEAEQAAEAQRTVAGFLEAFAAKMLEKSGGVANEVSYTGAADPFSFSTITIDGVKWNTKCIINVSKYGKLFNQWPTRRVK